MAKTKKVNYHHRPNLERIARSQEEVQRMRTRRRVINAVVRGESYEQIASDQGITENEAVTLAKETLKKWSTDLGETANEARALDLHRMNAMLAKLDPLIHPEPYLDAATGLMTIPKPDVIACKLALEIVDRRAKIYGYDAAHKMEEKKAEILTRIYQGVATNSKGEIDI